MMNDTISEQWAEGFTKAANAAGIEDPAQIEALMRVAQKQSISQQFPEKYAEGFDAIMEKEGIGESVRGAGFWGGAADIGSLGTIPAYRGLRGLINPSYRRGRQMKHQQRALSAATQAGQHRRKMSKMDQTMAEQRGGSQKFHDAKANEEARKQMTPGSFKWYQASTPEQRSTYSTDREEWQRQFGNKGNTYGYAGSGWKPRSIWG